MLDMNVHPSPFNLVDVVYYQPVKKYSPARSRLGSLVRVIKMVVHSPAEVGSQTDVKDLLQKRR